MDTPIIDISCFGAIRPLKNHLAQALAAIHFADVIGAKLRFHINANRKELGGEPILKNLIKLFENSDSELVLVKWLDHPEFLQYIKDNIDIGMQVSFTETYNIVAADHVICNVPVLTSKEVPFIHPFFQADPTSFEEMVGKLICIKRTRWMGLHRLNNRRLRKQNREAVWAWEDALTHL